MKLFTIVGTFIFVIGFKVALTSVVSSHFDEPYEPEINYRIAKQANLRYAEKCGFYGLKNGQGIVIQSTNFNKLTAKYEQCSWRILGHRCTLKTSCPCVDVPYTGECSSDYLKISDTKSFDHTFCGESQPVGVYNSTSSLLTFSYRSDGREVSNGFVCYVTCTGKGERDPPALRTNGVTCRV